MISTLSEWATGLNWIDVALLLGLLAGFLVGVGVGFYRQVAIFSALLVGVVAAAVLATPLAASEPFAPVVDALDPGGARVVAFAAVLTAALLCGLLVCLVFHSTFSKTLRFVDGLLGGAMGVAISGLVFGVLLLGIFHFEQSRLHDPIAASKIGSRLAEGARVVARIFPEDIQQHLDHTLASR